MKQIPIYGDPSTSVRFKAAVGAQGFHWIDGDNSVDSGIKETAGAIQEGRVRILRDACPRLRDDLSGLLLGSEGGGPRRGQAAEGRRGPRAGRAAVSAGKRRAGVRLPGRLTVTLRA